MMMEEMSRGEQMVYCVGFVLCCAAFLYLMAEW